jgi:choline dehydrogenase
VRGGIVLLEERSRPGHPGPAGLQACLAEFPFASVENTNRFGVPESCWSWVGGVVRPKSRRVVRLTGSDPRDPVEIDANLLSQPDDVAAAVACVELCREIGNSAAMRPFVKREVMPGDLHGADLVGYVRDAVVTYGHQSGTAKMGRDELSVVDGQLNVHGIARLRVADASIMPRIATGNTMAPCVMIGERAGELLRAHHGL